MSEKPDMQVEEGKAVYSTALPEQKAFFKIPARFGHVPVAEEPLGYDHERRFEQHYPRIELPFQLVDTVETGIKRRYEKEELFPNGLNRLFFGDCLHVMRMLPSECIDLIYIDPPFFSGRNYNIIFGDKNEVRSFTDIWEGGMPGYLIWLNARLYEMKRLLKPTGSIYVHLDWHASHYVKCEMDRIFGYENFHANVVWCYKTRQFSKRYWNRKHDDILFFTRSGEYPFNWDDTKVIEQYDPATVAKYKLVDEKGLYRLCGRGIQGSPIRSAKDVDPKWEKTHPELVVRNYLGEGYAPSDYWQIDIINQVADERIGYPTQKPERLLERIVAASTNKGDVVADFFCGGGTTLSVAQRHGRRWIGCDISRVAVALTADRIARILAPNLEEIKRAAKKAKAKKDDGELALEHAVADSTLTSVEDAKKKAVEASTMPLTGYTVEHWGIYEINRLTKLSAEEFRAFVVACYGARKWTGADANIQGVKANELLWVAGPKETDVITATDVKNFAQAVMKTRKPEERQAIMIGWGVDPKARAYAEQVMKLGEAKPIQFIKLRLWPLAGDDFKAHVTKKHDKYKDFFAFILPPDIPRIGVTRIGARHYRFDVSEARSMNTGGKIVNVQWDFDFRDGIFSATQGYQLCRKEKKERGEGGFEGQMTVEYTFDAEAGTPASAEATAGREVTLACRVQDDLGGEGMKAMKLKME
ncbi:MAG: site-specific DNA-methyltransferase [Kiritimatiellia bacterium]